MCFRLNQVYMCLSQTYLSIHLAELSYTPVHFVVSPMGFLISSVQNLLLGLTPEKFGKFPDESSSPHWGTETGCLNHVWSDISDNVL